MIKKGAGHMPWKWLFCLAVLAGTLLLLCLPAAGRLFQTMVNDTITYETGVVLEVSEESLSPSPLKGGQQLGTQELQIRLSDGQVVAVTNYLTDTHNVQASAGMRVVVCVDAPEGVPSYYTLYNYDRTGSVCLILAVFFLLMILVGRKKGLFAGVALLFALVFLLRVTLPAIYSGVSPVLMGLATVLAVTAVTIFLLYGFTVRGALAVGVTLAGEGLACLLFGLFSGLLHLSGFQSSDAESLLVVAQNTGLDISTVLFAATMIASLGAVMDVAVSLLSALWEVHIAGGGEGSLFRAGLRIGQDMLATNCNTLIFAFAGDSLTTVLVLFSYGVSASQLISSDYVALELSSGLCGACAVILTVPLASAAAALMFPKAKMSG